MLILRMLDTIQGLQLLTVWALWLGLMEDFMTLLPLGLWTSVFTGDLRARRVPHICSYESLLRARLQAKARVVDLFCPWWNPLPMASNWQSNESVVMLYLLYLNSSLNSDWLNAYLQFQVKNKFCLHAGLVQLVGSQRLLRTQQIWNGVDRFTEFMYTTHRGLCFLACWIMNGCAFQFLEWSAAVI